MWFLQAIFFEPQTFGDLGKLQGPKNRGFATETEGVTCGLGFPRSNGDWCVSQSSACKALLQGVGNIKRPFHAGKTLQHEEVVDVGKSTVLFLTFQVQFVHFMGKFHCDDTLASIKMEAVQNHLFEGFRKNRKIIWSSNLHDFGFHVNFHGKFALQHREILCWFVGWVWPKWPLTATTRFPS